MIYNYVLININIYRYIHIVDIYTFLHIGIRILYI